MPSPHFPLNLLDLVTFKKVDQRFGLVGIGRLMRLIELVIQRGTKEQPLSGVIAWGDFMQALGCNDETANEFLAYCDHARALDRADEDGRLRLTLRGDLAERLGPSKAVPVRSGDKVLYVTDKQWSEWFKGELNCPPYLANDPHTRALFRRWCATNVTVDEVEAATELAIAAGQAPHPAILHDHIKVIRQTKIERASR